MLQGFSERLYTSPFSTYLRTEFWIIPVSQTIHILCVAIVIASAAAISARMVGVMGRDQPLADFAKARAVWVFGALTGLVLTGTIQTLAEPEREFGNPIYLTKMALVLLATVLSGVFLVLLKRQTPLSTAGRIFGFLLVFLWALITICGRWIAYL